MTFARNFTILSLTLSGLVFSSDSAHAGDLRKFFQTAQAIQREFQQQHPTPGIGLPTPPSYGQPGCPPHVCPPPPPPVHCVYCVYYLDCHRWRPYGTYQSRFEANQAQWQLQSQGYRTYIKVKHLGGYPSGGPLVNPFGGP